MPATSRLFRLFRACTAVLALAAVAGCAASEKSVYERHLATIIQPGPAANNDVVIAFNLDRGELPAEAVAIVEE